MKLPHWNKRFLESTRGRIIALLRGSTQTVSDLSQKLDLTDNAVRAHLATLERDGLVQQSGLQPGPRKPHFTYDLSSDAEQLFPKSYDAILSQLLVVLQEKLPDDVTESFLREVGSRLAAERALPKSANLEQRIQAVLQIFQDLGGMAVLEKHNDTMVIRGASCPLGAVSAHHHQVCQMAETLIEEIIQEPVRECCQKGEVPKCYFEIKVKNVDASRMSASGF